MNQADQLTPTDWNHDPWTALHWRADSSGGLAWADRAWLLYTGLESAEATISGWSPVVHPDDRASSLQAWRDGLERGGRFELMHRLRGADGQYRWFLERASKLPGGQGWEIVATDVNEAQAQMHTKASEAALEAGQRLLERAGVAVLEFDGGGRVRFASREAQAALGASGAALSGKPLGELMPQLLSLNVLERIAGPQTPAKSSPTDSQLGPLRGWVKFCPERFTQGFSVYFRGFEPPSQSAPVVKTPSVSRPQ
jgi:PAS domain-containing protein